MMQKRSISLALALLWAAMPALSAATADEARVWIERMNKAVVERNFDGVLERKWIGGSAMLRVIHRMKDSQLSERVIFFGSSYENTRNGTQLMEYDHSKRVAVVQTLTRSYGFVPAFNGIKAESDNYYEIQNVGRQRLPNYARPTQQINVLPKDPYRYGYKFWLDQESAMPIMTQLVNSQGKVLDQLFFQSLSFPDVIDDELLKVNNKGYDFRKPAESSLEARRAFEPREALLPPGFRVLLKLNSRDGKDGASGPFTRFLVSDGVTWVSVTVSVAGPQRSVGETQVSPWTARFPFRLDGHDIVVMGDAPPAAVKAIAEAVRPE
jgi:sigma-E factor negative regulatory protein RseB